MVLVIGCQKLASKDKIDLSHLDEAAKQKMIERVQEDVNEKRPFQGSITHQKKCDTLIVLNHNVTGALQEKSTPYTKIGDYHIAFPLLEEATDVDAKDALYYYSWLLLYYFRDYERAIQRLNQYDDFTPNEFDIAQGENVNYLKGLAYKQMGKYKDAIKEFSKAIEDEGKNVDLYAYIYRGISYLKNGNISLAIEDFDRAINQYNNCSTAYYWKGEALIAANNKKEALENYNNALELLQKGYFKSDSYMEFFDIPSTEQVEDKLKVVSSKSLVK